MIHLIGRGALVLSLTLLLAGPGTTWAEDFYKGKTIRFIVGQAAGGGYDTYVRTIARHISKHIPGNPRHHRGKYGRRGELDLGQLRV